VVQRSLAIQQQLLAQVTVELSTARSRLAQLERQYARDRRMLASQLLADYESPTPTLVQVIMESRGFQDLLNRVSNLKTIARTNAQIIQLVQRTRLAVAAEARRLAKVKVRRQQTTTAVLDERDQIDQLKISIVNRELRYVHDRSAAQVRLTSLKKELTTESAQLEAEAASAQPASLRLVVSPPGGCVNTPFVAHGGEFGFFPAPGTNYTVNQEPIIAARLDAMGRALQLHLIGISGYRTPQHSVEVGGFADDPHTRGEASDTPGVEGVPEATLEEFCLTRPFPGAREADHIQEL
jgi:Peptidase M15